MSSSNGKKFRVTWPLCGKFTGHRRIPLTIPLVDRCCKTNRSDNMRFKSSLPNDAFMRIWIGSALVQIMACRRIHYLNQCCITFNWTIRNKIHWNHNRNSYIFSEEYSFENVFCEIAAILSMGDELSQLFRKQEKWFSEAILPSYIVEIQLREGTSLSVKCAYVKFHRFRCCLYNGLLIVQCLTTL